MLKQHDPSTDKLPEYTATTTRDSVNSNIQWHRDNESVSGTGESDMNEDNEGLLECEEMTRVEIAKLQYILTIANECCNIGEACDKLGTPPSRIVDMYRSVLGDGFHLMD